METLNEKLKKWNKWNTWKTWKTWTTWKTWKTWQKWQKWYRWKKWKRWKRSKQWKTWTTWKTWKKWNKWKKLKKGKSTYLEKVQVQVQLSSTRSLCHRCFSLRGAVRNHGGVLSRAGHHPRSHGVLLPRSGSTLQGCTDPERASKVECQSERHHEGTRWPDHTHKFCRFGAPSGIQHTILGIQKAYLRMRMFDTLPPPGRWTWIGAARWSLTTTTTSGACGLQVPIRQNQSPWTWAADGSMTVVSTDEVSG